MRYLIPGLLAISIFCAAPALAEGSDQQLPTQDAAQKPSPLKAMQKPIFLDYGASPLLGVTFNHSTHKGIKCRLCHHIRTDDGQLYASCTSEGCHDIKGARERDTMSMFMAYHDPDTDRSCYGCHRREAKTHPEFRGCRPCHMSPMARKAAADNAELASQVK